MLNLDRVERAMLVKALECYREIAHKDDKVLVNRLLRTFRKVDKE